MKSKEREKSEELDINMTERRKKAGRIQMNIIYGKEEEKRGR